MTKAMGWSQIARCSLQQAGRHNPINCRSPVVPAQRPNRIYRPQRPSRSTTRIGSSNFSLELADPGLVNTDLLPVTLDNRTFGTYELASLWIGLVISNTTFFLAGALINIGFNWWQGILCIFISNVIVLLPMVLNGHPGTEYGLPSPVLSRAAFGVKGANLPSLARGLVACGWFGIQTWIGSTVIHQLLMLFGVPHGVAIPWLGISASQFGCFVAFWAAQLGIILNGMEGIRLLEGYAAPVLIVLSAALLVWARAAAGGWGTMLTTPSQFGAGMPQHGKFWSALAGAVTANVGYWASLSLNIPDFTRYAKSQKDQILGQAIGLPVFMAGFSFVGLAVTSATPIIFGTTITDPVDIVSRLGNPVAVSVGLAGFLLATISTNIAANVVAPVNALVNLAPSRISFRAACTITALLGAAIRPWHLISSSEGFMRWLLSYSALLGPLGGVLIADYHIVRRRQLAVQDLYSMQATGHYWYHGGWNPAALWACAIGVAPSVPGFLHEVGLVSSVAGLWQTLYSLSWFVGSLLAMAVYCWLMRRTGAA